MSKSSTTNSGSVGTASEMQQRERGGTVLHPFDRRPWRRSEWRGEQFENQGHRDLYDMALFILMGCVQGYACVCVYVKYVYI